MPNTEQWNQAFQAPLSRAERFVSDMLDRLPPVTQKSQVLDLGCGTGTHAARLAQVWQQAHITGVDISEASIRQAEKLRRQLPEGDRLCFLAQDYMKCHHGPYDLIYSDSCLHLIATPTQQLFAKVAADLKPGGYLVCSMPCPCLFNTVLFLVRRMLRLVRCRASDFAIFSLAKLLHAGDMPVARLKERVQYMYVIPQRLGSKSLEGQLTEQFQLDCQGVYPYHHASLGQPRHKLWVFQRRKTVALAA
jgi:SAM-dependent methyltransferase